MRSHVGMGAFAVVNLQDIQEERERDTEREKERERERVCYGLCLCDCLHLSLSVFFFFYPEVCCSPDSGIVNGALYRKLISAGLPIGALSELVR